MRRYADNFMKIANLQVTLQTERYSPSIFLGQYDC